MTKTPAKTLAPGAATAGGADPAATKARAKPATKVSSSAVGATAANSPSRSLHKGRHSTDERRKILCFRPEARLRLEDQGRQGTSPNPS